MTFDIDESSVEGSRPNEAYKIILGGDEFYFTSGEDEVIIDGNDYVPTEIKRTVIALGKAERTKVLTIELPISTALAQRYVGPPPGVRASVQVFRYQRTTGPTDKALIYSGTVKSVTFPRNGTLASFQCQTLEASSDRAIPRHTYMGMCNHLLYSPACGVIQNDFKHVGLVSLVDSNNITIVGLSASGLAVKGGFLDNATGTEKRQILAVSSDIVTLLLPFEVDPTGTSITAFAGCNRVLTQDCAVIFENEERFGGFAFVPDRNPFTAGI